MLNNRSKIKTGDYLKTEKKPALFYIGKNKICFSKNSSLKIENISLSNDKIDFKILSGKFLIKTNKNSKFIFNIKMDSKVVKNNHDHLYIQKGSYNSVLLGKIRNKDSINDHFLNECFYKIKDLNPSKKSLFKCFPKKNRLSCGYK